jgi:hypothetical protein
MTTVSKGRVHLGAVERYPSSPLEEYLRSPASGEFLRAPAKLTDLLLNQPNFLGIEELIRTTYLSANLGSWSLPEGLYRLMKHDPAHGSVSALIQGLTERGFFIGEDQLLAPASPETSPDIHMIAIPTCNRPSHLRRAVASLAGHLTESGRTAEIIVADDTKDEAGRAANLAGLETIAGEFPGFRFRYADENNKRSFAARLATASGCDPNIAIAALCGQAKWGLGANRNAILADTAGEAVIMMDDDIVCSISQHPFYQGGLAIGPEMAPLDHWPFESRDQIMAMRSKHMTRANFVELHNQVLGRGLSRLAHEASGVVFDRACFHLLKALQAGTARVRISFMGVAGDCARSSNLGILTTDPPSTRQRILDSKGNLRVALSSREAFRCVSQTHIVHGPPWVGWVMGIDNTRSLPPFPPACVNEDYLFGLIVSTRLPDSFTAHLPFAVLHEPPPGREQRHHLIDTAARMLISDVFVQCVHEDSDHNHNGPDAEISRLGMQLTVTGNLATAAFRDFILDRFIHHSSQELAVYDRAAQNGLGSALKAELQPWLTSRERFLSRSADIFPSDAGGQSPSENWENARQAVLRYGQILSAWPGLMASAGELRRNGVRLSVPL